MLPNDVTPHVCMYLKYYFIECKQLKYVLIIEKLVLAFFSFV